MAPVSTRRNATIIALVIGSALVHTLLRSSFHFVSHYGKTERFSITNALQPAHDPALAVAAAIAAATVHSSEPLQPAAAAEPQPPLQTSQPPPPPPPLAAAAAAVAAAAVPAAVAAEAGCPYRLRLLHWNVQQTKAADAAKLRAVLRYARAHRYDAVSLNELSNTEEELRAIGAPHGYAHARLLQGAHATRLGVLSSHPLVDARPPLTAGIGHGLLCVRVRRPGKRLPR